MARFYLLSFLLLLALTAVAMISCLSAEAGTVRGLPRGLWVVLILLVPLVGPVLYFAFGRPRRGDGTGLGTGLPPAPKSRPLAPDDDADFLSRLGRGRPTPGPTPPRPAPQRPAPQSPAPQRPTDDTRATDNPKVKDDPEITDNPEVEDNTQTKDDGRTRGDARTKDDGPPSDSAR